MLSTFEDIWRQVVLRCPAASIFLARQWTSYAFRQIVERRRWSWLCMRGQFLLNAVYNTGNVDCTLSSATVQGHATGWTTALINRQFRPSLQIPIYTIIAVDAVNQRLTLDAPFGGASVTGVGYEIWNAYVTVPSDFQSFISLWDPKYNWQLWTNVQQTELNAWDAQRANSGTAYVAAQYTYDPLSGPPPLPRYEIWPHQKSQYAYPFLYISRPPDLEDAGASLPRYIRGDVLLEMALAQCARWPGATKSDPNPYFNLALAMQHDTRAERMIIQMETQDDEVYSSDLMFAPINSMPFVTPFGDSRWLQSHDF